MKEPFRPQKSQKPFAATMDMCDADNSVFIKKKGGGSKKISEEHVNKILKIIRKTPGYSIPFERKWRRFVMEITAPKTQNDWEKPKKTCNNQNAKKISKVDLCINKFKALEEGGGNEVTDPDGQKCGNLEDISISTDKSIKRKIRAGRVRRWKKMSNFDEVTASCVENIENEFNKAETITTPRLRSKMRAGALQVARPQGDGRAERHAAAAEDED